MPKFEVRTLDINQLAAASAELAAATTAFNPDLIVGIRSGGFAVAWAMAPHFPDITLLPITCRRAGTEKKQRSSLLKQLLRKLPDGITGWLRVAEHMMLTRRRPAAGSAFVPDKEELAAVENYLRRLGKNPHILIVDDAVDSGATLSAVARLIRTLAGPDAVIKTAVITVTTTTPFIEPDYLLYRYVLCRFPWSLDFKN